MIIIRAFKFLISGIFLLYLSSCSPIIYTSTWQSKDFNNIISSEWQEPFRFHDENSSLQYNISNDSTKLYICIKTSDLNDQYKIMLAGMQVWIDTISKNKHQTGILFPFTNDNKISNNLSNNKILKNSGLNKQKKQFLSDSENIHLKGFNPEIDSVISNKNKFGISVSLSWDSIGTLYYKAIIPFYTFYKKIIMTSDNEKVFTFSAIVKPMSKLNNKEEKNYRKEKMSEESDDDDITKEQGSSPGERKSFAGGKGSYGVRDATNNNQHEGNNLNEKHSEVLGESSQKSSSPYEETIFTIKFKLVYKPTLSL